MNPQDRIMGEIGLAATLENRMQLREEHVQEISANVCDP